VDNFSVSFAQDFAWVAFFYAEGRHTVRVEVSDGTHAISAEWQIDLLTTAVHAPAGHLPAQFQLAQVFPNPLRAAATPGRIMFQTARLSVVDLVIYDVMGRRVRHLLRAEKPAGAHQASWEGRDDNGRLLPAGVYLLHMTAGGFQATQKLVLVK
ncbi:T9SS type A sorting domain-containing protein, partial [candidate division KSB1 bacterium]|nr:T9SS type A sorting domain-containing protein [candidate division KSB1 bacterium]